MTERELSVDQDFVTRSYLRVAQRSGRILNPLRPAIEMSEWVSGHEKEFRLIIAGYNDLFVGCIHLVTTRIMCGH